MMLANFFLISIAQRLIPKKDGKGRILALEKLSNSARVRQMIRDGKTHQIRSQMQVGGEDFVSNDISLADPFKRNVIDFEEGELYADDKKLYQDLARG